MKLAVTKIREDGGTQARAELELDAVATYAEAMRRGDEFPPVVVFYDGKDYWLADGFHRVAAAVDVSLAELEADVRQGTRRDAVLFSVGANAVHGVQRSNADKRRAVGLLLSDLEWRTWSDRDIAKACRVSHTFVAKVKAGTETLAGGNVATPWPAGGNGYQLGGNGIDSLPPPPSGNIPASLPRGGNGIDSLPPASSGNIPASLPRGGNGIDSLPPASTDIVLVTARLEDRLSSLTTDICEAPARVQRAIGPALDVALRRLSRVASGSAA